MADQSDAERYLEQACECEEYAEKSVDAEAARKFREAAASWRKLAADWTELNLSSGKPPLEKGRGF